MQLISRVNGEGAKIQGLDWGAYVHCNCRICQLIKYKKGTQYTEVKLTLPSELV